MSGLPGLETDAGDAGLVYGLPEIGQRVLQALCVRRPDLSGERGAVDADAIGTVPWKAGLMTAEAFDTIAQALGSQIAPGSRLCAPRHVHHDVVPWSVYTDPEGRSVLVVLEYDFSARERVVSVSVYCAKPPLAAA